MQRLALALAWILLSAVPALAQIGPGEPRAACHDFSLGGGFHNVSSTWKPFDYDVDRGRFYLEGSFAFNHGIEGFLRAGGSDVVINEIETYEPGKDKDVSSQGYPAFLSGGVRGTFWQWGPWTLGGSFEAAWYAGLERYIRWDYDAYQQLYVDPTVEFNAGLSLAYDFGFGTFYWGPLVHFGYTNADVRTHEFGPNWDVEEEINALNVRDKAGFGGLFGWQMPLGGGGWNLQIEGSVLSGGFGIGVGFFHSHRGLPVRTYSELPMDGV